MLKKRAVKSIKETKFKKTKQQGKISNKDPMPPAVRLKRKNLFDKGDLISMTSRSGVTFIGKYNGTVQGSYHLLNAEILDGKDCVKTPWLLLEIDAVSHIYPKTSDVVLKKDLG